MQKGGGLEIELHADLEETRLCDRQRIGAADLCDLNAVNRLPAGNREMRVCRGAQQVAVEAGLLLDADVNELSTSVPSLRSLTSSPCQLRRSCSVFHMSSMLRAGW